MPTINLCDVCGCRCERNAASSGVTSKRGNLVVHSKVVKANGSEPIVCAKCVRLAVQHGDEEVAA